MRKLAGLIVALLLALTLPAAAGTLDEDRRSAEAGNAQGQFELGMRYANGKEVPKDPTEAVKWLRLAAEQGHAGAQNNLGSCYIGGIGVERDYSQASEWFRKAAEQDDGPGLFHLGGMYRYGLGMARDYGQAAALYKRAAEKGVPFANGPLGYLYLIGAGVEKDYAEAAKWFWKAADWEPSSQYMLAMMIFNNLVTEGNVQTARSLLGQAVQRGYAPAQYTLASSYDSGGKVAEAIKLYEAAAAKDYPPALNNLGVHYALGLGVPQDTAKAMELYKKAAAKGHPRAMSSLGVMYLNGQGTAVDYAEARKWFERAAAQGFAEAYNNLAAMCLQGKGMESNAVKGYILLRLAADGGQPVDRALLAKLEGAVPPAEMEGMKQMLREWKIRDSYWTDWKETLRYGWTAN